MHSPSQKLQKVLASHGLGARRTMEEWIAQGRIKVNGKVATIGQRVEPQDHIAVDGKLIQIHAPSKGEKTSVQSSAAPVILLYHKPVGYICTRRDPQGRPTVFEHLPSPPHGRWISVGRLDLNSSGLLLFTHCGDTAHQLMHPSFGWHREYKVRVKGQVNQSVLKRLKSGVYLEDGPAKFLEVVRMKATQRGLESMNQWYKVVVGEGRNRLVRRLWTSQDVMVSRLIRVCYGPFELPEDLRPGQFCKVVWQP